MTYKEIFDANNEDLQDILDAVNDLPDAGSGGITPSGTKTITENGTYDVTEYASAVVNVASSGSGAAPVIVPLTITENGGYDATLEGADGYNPVFVDVATSALDAMFFIKAPGSEHAEGIPFEDGVTWEEFCDAMTALVQDEFEEILPRFTYDENGVVYDARYNGAVENVTASDLIENNAAYTVASSGTAYETCTLRFVPDSNETLSDVSFFTLNDDGTLRPYYWSSPLGELVFENVVVGLPCWCYIDSATGNYYANMTNATEIEGTYGSAEYDESEKPLFFVCTVPGGETLIVFGTEL